MSRHGSSSVLRTCSSPYHRKALQPYANMEINPFRSDADADVLADYVMALMDHDGDLAKVRKLCEAEIPDFLKEGTWDAPSWFHDPCTGSLTTHHRCCVVHRRRLQDNSVPVLHAWGASPACASTPSIRPDSSRSSGESSQNLAHYPRRSPHYPAAIAAATPARAKGLYGQPPNHAFKNGSAGFPV